MSAKQYALIVILFAIIWASLYFYDHRKDAVKQFQVTWGDAQTLVQRCEVSNIDPGAGDYASIRLKSGQMKTIVDHYPGVTDLEALAQGVSSTWQGYGHKIDSLK